MPAGMYGHGRNYTSLRMMRNKQNPCFLYLLFAIIITLLFVFRARQRPGIDTTLPITTSYRMHNHPSPLGRRANATILILARNSELAGVISSVKQLEDRWNKKFHYPYVFLNDEPFDANFKRRLKDLTDSQIEFGLIPIPDWVQPDWIDESIASKNREILAKQGVLYGGASITFASFLYLAVQAGSLSGTYVPSAFLKTSSNRRAQFFYRHELLTKYQFYWRVEPDVTYYCDIEYDPFLVMQDQDKLYGFTIALTEYKQTIPTLWKSVKDFMREYPQYVSPHNALDFISDDGGNSYNTCHFWSNFEIANMDLWRGEAYTKFFNFLDKKGGFHYERWGDAPVHSIAVSLLARRDQIHYFSDIGYKHDVLSNCPQGEQHRRGKCWCNPQSSHQVTNGVLEPSSCLAKYENLFR
ncbi:nucleotide-diphospho-sugar transferase [Crepidotus variabilis]|uniref:Nucleotide-diphospho-sugar transferase n=1 Tax=Crepidotus variabilis TaxID=179855 RepID=A0A9P6E532_9AGAR|nr:nucleotide-diphospho-sugar transferase [Crepidotus variabilis]